MKYSDRLTVEMALKKVPLGQLRIVHHTKLPGESSLTDHIHIQTDGKGQLDVYQVFPGVEASYSTFLASDVSFQHASSPSVMQLFYCRNGRVGWNMQGNTAVYLGAGDITVHSTSCCAHSAMMFPLGYAEGVSISVDLDILSSHCPDILHQAGLNFRQIKTHFCGEQPVAVPACEELTEIFTPLFRIDCALRLPYLQLKFQELLLYLGYFPHNNKELAQYFPQQTELIKEIHALITEHLEHRFTIEELSKRYAINTSTLKAVFKTVYGLPIASYMKEYRIRQAMKLLRETNDSIAQIATQVGYESQGKFANAFKEIVQQLPTEYRKHFLNNRQ